MHRLPAGRGERDDMNSKPHVAVLWGGTSSERNISEKTGRAVAEGLRLAGYPVSEIDAAGDFLAEIADVGQAFSLPTNQQPGKAAPRVVAFIALHGEFGEDGRIQQILEDNDIPYTGSGVRASRLAMDKVAAKGKFIRAGLDTPKYRVICVEQPSQSADSIDRQAKSLPHNTGQTPYVRRELDAAVARELGLPLVVKPVAGGSSIGISLLRSLCEWPEKALAVGQAFSLPINQQPEMARPMSGGQAPRVLIEEFISGRELTVAVMCGAGFQPADQCNQQPEMARPMSGGQAPRALPIIEMTFEGALFDYDAKYSKGTIYTEAPPLPAETEHAVKDAAARACACLGCAGVARVDLILSGDGVPYILEVNTIPGMTATSLVPKAARCAGIGFQELVSGIVKSGLASHSNAKGAEVGKARKASA